MQHNLTCLNLKRKMTIRKNAKMLTVFAFHWWGWGLGMAECEGSHTRTLVSFEGQNSGKTES